MIRSVTISTLFFLCFALFETTILANMLFLPAVPDFLLLILMYVAVNNGRLFGVTVGFISGLFLDFFSGCPFGLNCLLRTLMGYIFGLFSKTLNINGVILPALQGFLATLLKALLLWIISIFFPSGIKSYVLFSTPLAFELAFNTVLAPLMFAFMSLFDKYVLLSLEEAS